MGKLAKERLLAKQLAIHAFFFHSDSTPIYSHLAHFHAPEVVGPCGRRFSSSEPLPGSVGQHCLGRTPTKNCSHLKIKF
jgi:hypothetical protein